LFNVEAINAAIEAKDVAALQAIIVAFDIDAYNNLTSAQRAELTAYVIANTTEEVIATADFSATIFTDPINSSSAPLPSMVVAKVCRRERGLNFF